MNVYISSIILAIAAAGITVFSKLIPRDKYTAMDILPISNLITGIILLILALFIEGEAVLLGFNLYLLVSIIFNTIANVFFLIAIRETDISYVGPLEATRPLFTVFIVYILQPADITIFKIIGSLVIILGAYLLNNGHNGKNKISKNDIKGIAYLLISCMLFSIYMVTLKKSLEISGVYTNVSFLTLGMGLLSLAYFLMTKKKRNLQLVTSLIINKFFIFYQVFCLIAYFFLGYSLSLGKVLDVVPLQMSKIFFVFLAGIFIFKEKSNIKKFIGAIILFVGAVIASML